MEKQAPMQIEVSVADWLIPGRIMVLRTDKTYDAVKMPSEVHSAVLAKTFTEKLDEIRQETSTVCVYISSEDRALINEYFPDYLYRSDQ